VWPSTQSLAIQSRCPEDGAAEERLVDVASAPDDDPLATAARLALKGAGQQTLPDWLIEITSTIPVARGMGSSAAVVVAVARAIGLASGIELAADTVSEVAFEAERCTHGTPSGIDNTVIAWQHPVRFAEGQSTPLAVTTPLTLIVADSGQRAPTRELVAEVRGRHRERPRVYEDWFDRIGRTVEEASSAIANGELIRLGWLMNSNHLVLQALRVSTPELDRLVSVARHAGALGAKLSGAGGGGVMVALVEPESSEAVTAALRAAGAQRVIQTTVEATEGDPRS